MSFAKTIFNTLLLCTLSFTYAAELSNNQAQIQEPIFRFGAKDVSGTIHYWLPETDSHIFNRHQLNKEFCWEITNLPEQFNSITLRQTIVAPSNTSFTSLSTGNTTNSHEYTNILRLQVKDGRVSNCGRFQIQDPAGEYHLQITTHWNRYPQQTIILK